MSGRRLTTPSMVMALAPAIFVGAAGTAIANDGRLDQALANLEKASLLLLAADEQPQLNEKTEKESTPGIWPRRSMRSSKPTDTSATQ